MDTKRLVIVAVGGQGNLLASSVLGEAALLSGVPLHMRTRRCCGIRPCVR
jgi:indolepyruvate ferredoxin oxidoreductase beta subunit